MDSEQIWATIDRERADLADFVAGLNLEQWNARSLCAGWTVGNVATHLTHATLPVWHVLPVAVRSGFRFNSAIARAAVEDRATPAEISARLRAMVGVRRHPISTQPIDSMFDVLVHGQDMAIPLGVERSMPTGAAAAAAQRLWPSRFPFKPRADNPGVRFEATDADFAVGEGEVMRAPIADILLTFAGRQLRKAA